jgi:hypothetical protein
LSARNNPILVAIPRGPKGISPKARRRIRDTARRSNGAVEYDRNYLVVENNSLGLSVLDSIIKDLGNFERVVAYRLELIPGDRLKERLEKEEYVHRQAGIRRLGKNLKRRLTGVGNLGPVP